MLDSHCEQADRLERLLSANEKLRQERDSGSREPTWIAVALEAVKTTPAILDGVATLLKEAPTATSLVGEDIKKIALEFPSGFANELGRRSANELVDAIKEKKSDDNLKSTDSRDVEILANLQRIEVENAKVSTKVDEIIRKENNPPLKPVVEQLFRLLNKLTLDARDASTANQPVNIMIEQINKVLKEQYQQLPAPADHSPSASTEQSSKTPQNCTSQLLSGRKRRFWVR